MKKGKKYRNIHNNTIVLCTEDLNSPSSYFCGVVIKEGLNSDNIGTYKNLWVCKSFEEYISDNLLIKGKSYNIPEGCKAEVKDGVVIIKDTIEHFKIRPLIPSIYTIYIRKYPDRQINVYIFDSGYASISHNKIDAGDKCTEQEFMEAYNKALKMIKL